MEKYTYRITWSDDDQEWVGLCAEFPSLSHVDRNPEKAFKGIRTLVDNVVSDMKDDGENIPEPLSTKKYSGKFMLRIPPERHRDLVIEAQEQGISLNRLVSDRISA
ncbi:MAG: toxin-antitoxin system HicB family antitoxin [Micavibrio sp.]|nr:toxin-antitoxin system HicB family antitoxin [Micavibrio sp.]|tara:strand:+ start:543 stop:860 length:318 start_codon:yes stop_codon:yes gene_type:complete